MKKILKQYFLFILLFFVFSANSIGHSGRTDKNGGHYDRKTGEYHYHEINTEEDNSSALVVSLIVLGILIIGIFVKKLNEDE